MDTGTAKTTKTTKTTGTGLYCGMADDIISPFVLIPDLSILVAIDYFDSAFALYGTWEGQKEDILRSLTDGHDQNSYHYAIMLQYVEEGDNPPLITKLPEPATIISEGEMGDDLWVVQFRMENKNRVLYYYHHRNFVTQEWPEIASDISNVMCMGATFPLRDSRLIEMVEDRCRKDCVLHADEGGHEEFPNRGPQGTRTFGDNEIFTSSADILWAIDNWEFITSDVHEKYYESHCESC